MRDTYLRGQAAPIPATPEAWAAEARALHILQRVAQAERAIYGAVTAQTAALIAERVAQTEAAVVLQRAQETAALSASVDAAIAARRFQPGVQS